MLPYSPFQPEDLGPLAEVIPGPEPPLNSHHFPRGSRRPGIGT